MNQKKKIKKLEVENTRLKLEILKLKLDIADVSGEWRHPRSCLHNSDPWKYFK